MKGMETAKVKLVKFQNTRIQEECTRNLISIYTELRKHLARQLSELRVIKKHSR